MIRSAEWLGLPRDAAWPVRATFLVVAVWWLVFSLPTFIWVRPDARADLAAANGSPLSSYRSVLRTLRLVLRHRQLCRFLLAFFLYNDAVETVIVMAAAYGGAVLNMSAEELIVCFLMVQGVALVGSLVCGWIADRVGEKRTVIASLAIWAAVLGWACFIRSTVEFWAMSAVVGLVLGGTQAASRALMGELTPPAHCAAFFGFYGMSGKMAAILGPLLYGVVRTLTGSPRPAILSLLALLLAGLVLLTRVNQGKGVAEAAG
jgi:UMF1 family MFS transporter